MDWIASARTIINNPIPKPVNKSGNVTIMQGASVTDKKAPEHQTKITLNEFVRIKGEYGQAS